MIVPKKDYLGDGVYAEYDGYMVKLTTSNGLQDTNTIYLEPGILKSLKLFLIELEGD